MLSPMIAPTAPQAITSGSNWSPWLVGAKSLGGMIAEGRTSVHQAWWVLVFPLITLFLTVLSFSQLGEGLKDRFDPVLR